MKSTLIVGISCLMLLVLCTVARSQEVPQKTTICEMMRKPSTWNHKLVQVTGFATHGFEDSQFSDMDCDNGLGSFWMEYGGKLLTGTMSTASDLSRERTKSAVLDGIAVPLVDDATFRRFDQALHLGKTQRMIGATVIGRFFAKQESPDGHLKGYGHLGCCSLLLIQQVIDVDDVVHAGLDYSDDFVTEGWDCGTYSILTNFAFAGRAHKAQQAAEAGDDAFAFSRPTEVARRGLTEYAHEPSDTVLEKIKKTDGRVVYRAKTAAGVKYVITVSRPYILWNVAADHRKIAWAVLSVVRSCS